MNKSTSPQRDMLHRIVAPSRLALIFRSGQTLAYNPAVNTWELLTEDTAEVLRWVRAGRDRCDLVDHLERRFGYCQVSAEQRLREILAWCILRWLLYLDHEPEAPKIVHPQYPLETVYWICTQACNLRCTYCYQDAMVKRPNELSTAEGKSLVDQAVEAGAQTFIFTGGEPFSRRDLREIARHSRDHGLQTNVITNGHYITKRNAQDIAEIFNTVTISLDHGIPEHHERNRGPGSWQRAVTAIDLLLDAGAHVDVNSVLSRFGLTDVNELLRFSRSRMIGEHRIVPQFPMGRGSATRDQELTPRELMSVSDRLAHANRQLDQVGEARVAPEGTYSTKRMLRNHCGAGLSEVSVDPEGWVYPCKLLQYTNFKTDNVRDRPLIDIYNDHPILRRIRSTVADTLHPCKTCIIKNHCGGGCRGIHFSFSQEYIQAHPLFCSYLRRIFETQAWSSVGEVPAPRRANFESGMPEYPNSPKSFIPLSTLGVRHAES